MSNYKLTSSEQHLQISAFTMTQNIVVGGYRTKVTAVIPSRSITKQA